MAVVNGYAGQLFLGQDGVKERQRGDVGRKDQPRTEGGYCCPWLKLFKNGIAAEAKLLQDPV